MPEQRIRERYRRLYVLVAQARTVAHRTTFYDNSRAKPFRPVASFERGFATQPAAWPTWAPPELL